MSFEKVKLQDSFWLPRLETQAEVTVPFALEKTERAVENLRRCGNFVHGRGGEKPFTHRFVSSDLYKVMEGAAYILTVEDDPELEKQMDDIIDIIADAQQEDGYLYVSHICGVANEREMGKTPYSWVVHSHELYNLGHMYEGAIAYYQATGKDKWLQVAEKSAQHFNKVFFEGDKNYNDGKPVNQAPGHQEIELALCKLYRVTGKQLYLDMAKKFLDIRGVTYCPEGEGTMSPEYAQQHKPVRQQERAVGHAVRAAYLYAGMADVSAMTNDEELATALGKIWHNIVDTKMHITGGLGAVPGIEGFGPEYDLPNKVTYDETCSAVANVFFNFRMYLLHKDAKYFDVAEVSLLNNSLAGMSISGDKFFYVNPLEADGIMMFNHGKGGRSPWYDCACCPSNLARLMPQISGYMYANTDDEIYLTLYGSSQTDIVMGSNNIAIKQVSDYPFDGKITLNIDPSADQEFALKLRIPSWVQQQFVPGQLYEYADGVKENWTLTVNGKEVASDVEKGFATVNRTWEKGDVVELNLPMPIRYNVSSDKIKANHNRLAITRGPLVYCAEEADNDTGMVQRFFVPAPANQDDVNIEMISDGVLKGVPRLTVPGKEIAGDSSKDASVKLVPYYAWNNRGDASMIVWMPRNAQLATEGMKSNLLNKSQYGEILASHTWKEDDIAAITDGNWPKVSADQSLTRWTSLPYKNRRGDISIDFPEIRKLASVSVYWYEDATGEKVKLPREWWVEYKNGDGEWKRMTKYITDFYGLKKDTFNMVRPEQPLTCDAIRIRVLPQVEFCMGIHEIELSFEE
ncbi:MAG: glycoside hydrolase family 127 protein [Phycisphaerae bacterium]|nr:glycoside hydrolase family 127 protein [Phycisphaerae bacterium]